MVVDPREPEVLERQGRQAGHRVLGGQLAPGHGAEKLSKPTFIQSLRIVQSRRCLPRWPRRRLPRVSPLPAERLTLLVYVALASSLALGVAVAVLAARLRGARRTYATLLAGGAAGEDILAAVARQVEATERLRGKLNLVGRETAQLRQRVSSLGRHRRPDPLRRLPRRRRPSLLLGGVPRRGRRRGRPVDHQRPLRDPLLRQAGPGRQLRPPPVGRGARRHHPRHERPGTGQAPLDGTGALPWGSELPHMDQRQGNVDQSMSTVSQPVTHVPGPVA